MTYEELLENNILDVFTDIQGDKKIIRLLATRGGKVVGKGTGQTLQGAIDQCEACIKEKVFQCM